MIIEKSISSLSDRLNDPTYVPDDVTAFDDIDGVITEKIVNKTGNIVDLLVPGKYTINYQVEDTAYPTPDIEEKSKDIIVYQLVVLSLNYISRSTIKQEIVRRYRNNI